MHEDRRQKVNSATGCQSMRGAESFEIVLLFSL